MTLPFLPSSNWSQMESQKKHRRELTAKQRALVRALAKTKHLGKAAIEAGYSPKNATQSAAQALASIRKTAPGLLAKHGLDDDSLIEKHLIPLLQAQETKYFAYTRQGKRLLLERNVAAHSIRANALDMAFQDSRAVRARAGEQRPGVLSCYDRPFVSAGLGGRCDARSRKSKFRV
jgi:hypothetical protein